MVLFPVNEGPACEENDETKKMLKQLTIAMISEVIDERTVLIRDAASKGPKRTFHLNLCSVGEIVQGESLAAGSTSIGW